MDRSNRICPICQSRIISAQINIDQYLDMCENIECEYPFSEPDVEGFIFDTPYNETRYSNNLNTSSSSVANFEPLKASDVVTHSSKSVEESSLNDDSFTTSSLPTQITIDNSIAATATALQELINITQQKPPVASSLVLPTDIAFPPESAATSSNNNNNFTLDDINSLLLNDKSTTDTIECQTPSSPNVTTPEDSNNMSWMENMDVLFGEDMAQAKVDPFSGDSEFDSLLGL